MSDVLITRVGEELYAFHLEHIHKIIDLQPLTRLSGAPKHVKGIFSYEGSVLKVVDLKLILFDSHFEKNDKVIVFQKDDRHAGFIVQAIHDIVHLDGVRLSENHQKVPESKEMFKMENVFKYQNKLVTLIDSVDLDKLL